MMKKKKKKLSGKVGFIKNICVKGFCVHIIANRELSQGEKTFKLEMILRNE